MKIDNSFIVANKLNTPPIQKTVEKPDNDITGGFKSILDDLMEASKEASHASKVEAAKLMTGTMEDFPEFMVTGEKSSILFEMNLTVRTKVIEAYTEILRTQV